MPSLSGFKRESTLRQYGMAMASVALVCLTFLQFPFFGYRTVALVLLLTVSTQALLMRRGPVFLGAISSALLWNFLFIPPVFTFHIGTAEDGLMFLMYFAVALVHSVLTIQIRKAERKAREGEEKEKTLAFFRTILNSLSHELKTPLAAILSSTENLLERSQHLSEKQRLELIQEIAAGGRRLQILVEHLLNANRLESGMLEIRPDWLDPEEWLHHLLREFGDATGNRIRIASNSPLPLMQTDPVLLSVIVGNLLRNALKYSQKEVDIQLSYSEGEGFRIQILDQGPGVPEEERERIFEKFVRLPGSKAGGSGLGLYIARGFTEALGGRLSLENRLEGGAVFSLVVPCPVSYLNQLEHE